MNTLIERLRVEAVHPTTTLQMRLITMEAADALESKDAEIERLDKANKSLHEYTVRVNNERDQLQAKLDALQKQEPIYQYKRGDGSWIDQTQTSYENNVKHGAAEVRIVYAAPVVEPEQDHIDRAFNDWYGNGVGLGVHSKTAIRAAFDVGVKLAAPVVASQPLTNERIDELSRTMVKGDKSVNWLCRAIERAHGIGGQP